MTYPPILQTAELFFYATYLSTGSAYYLARVAEIASTPEWLNATFYASFIAYAACKLPSTIAKILGYIGAFLRRGWDKLRHFFDK